MKTDPLFSGVPPEKPEIVNDPVMRQAVIDAQPLPQPTETPEQYWRRLTGYPVGAFRTLLHDKPRHWSRAEHDRFTRRVLDFVLGEMQSKGGIS